MKKIKLNTEENENKRLDIWLMENLEDLSRNQIQNLIKNGNVKIQDTEKKLTPSYKISQNENYVIEIPLPEKYEKAEAENIPLDILYEDKNLIVINKPTNLSVHPGAGRKNGTLVNALLYHCKGELSGIGGFERPGIVHRIDKDTSGILVAAKDDLTHKGLAKQFEKHTITRAYLALCYGLFKKPEGKIEGHIGRSRANRQKMAIVNEDKGKSAITNYHIKSYYNKHDISLVKFKLETGRTHQIRVHTTSLGHPIIGDKTYGSQKKHIQKIQNETLQEEIKKLDRQMLHAYQLGFIHPITKKEMLFKSPPPKDMQNIIDILEKN